MAVRRSIPVSEWCEERSITSLSGCRPWRIGPAEDGLRKASSPQGVLVLMVRGHMIDASGDSDRWLCLHGAVRLGPAWAQPQPSPSPAAVLAMRRHWALNHALVVVVAVGGLLAQGHGGRSTTGTTTMRSPPRLMAATYIYHEPVYEAAGIVWRCFVQHLGGFDFPVRLVPLACCIGGPRP